MLVTSYNGLSLVESVNVVQECLSVQMISKIGRAITSIGGCLSRRNSALTIGDRFVDRDMLMRYYWGLGIGHVHSHGLVGVPYAIAHDDRAQV